MPKFYKFREFNLNTLSSLSTGSLYASRLHKMNDPYERRYGDLNQKVLKSRAGEMSQDYFGQIMTSNFGVLCLSANTQPDDIRTNPLMWAHYGGDQTGLIIGVDFGERTNVLAPIEYVATEQIASRREQLFRVTNDRSLSNCIKAIFCLKHSYWSYEQEHRCLTTLNKTQDGVPFKDYFQVTDITFGSRTTEYDHQLVWKLLGDTVNYQIIVEKSGKLTLEDYSPQHKLHVAHQDCVLLSNTGVVAKVDNEYKIATEVQWSPINEDD